MFSYAPITFVDGAGVVPADWLNYVNGALPLAVDGVNGGTYALLHNLIFPAGGAGIDLGAHTKIHDGEVPGLGTFVVNLGAAEYVDGLLDVRVGGQATVEGTFTINGTAGHLAELTVGSYTRTHTLYIDGISGSRAAVTLDTFVDVTDNAVWTSTKAHTITGAAAVHEVKLGAVMKIGNSGMLALGSTFYYLDDGAGNVTRSGPEVPTNAGGNTAYRALRAEVFAPVSSLGWTPTDADTYHADGPPSGDVAIVLDTPPHPLEFGYYCHDCSIFNGHTLSFLQSGFPGVLMATMSDVGGNKAGYLQFRYTGNRWIVTAAVGAAASYANGTRPWGT